MGLDLAFDGRGPHNLELLTSSRARRRLEAPPRSLTEDDVAEFLQFLFSGLTVGAIYALVALGFAIIYNASHVINFAQGEFVMIGGMATVFLAAAGLPLPLAVPLAIAARGRWPGWRSSASRWRRRAAPASPPDHHHHRRLDPDPRPRGGRAGTRISTRCRAFSGRGRRSTSAAPCCSRRSLWVIGAVAAVVVGAAAGSSTARGWGKAMLATAHNPLAAQLVGIDPAACPARASGCRRRSARWPAS